MEERELIDAISKAFAPAVEMQLLASKGALNADEVSKFYGITRSRLEHLRMQNRGPQYVRMAERGSVLYTHDAIRTWLQMNSITPRAV